MMIVGLFVFIFGLVVFIGWVIFYMYYLVFLGSYVFRGLGYLLFVYFFFVWVLYSIFYYIFGKVVGWFWFMFMCGFNVFGLFYFSYVVLVFGEINMFWSVLLFVVVGGFFVLFFNKDKFILV